MNRIAKILIFSVVLVTASFVVLFIAAYLTPKHNQIPVWRTNLEAIEEAKQIWQNNEVIKTNNSPTWDDLMPYLSIQSANHFCWTNGELLDSQGGIYTIGRVDEMPSCSVQGVQKFYSKF